MKRAPAATKCTPAAAVARRPASNARAALAEVALHHVVEEAALPRLLDEGVELAAQVAAAGDGEAVGVGVGQLERLDHLRVLVHVGEHRGRVEEREVGGAG